MSILLQPASGPEAKKHFKDTIANGVYLSTFRQFLSEEEYTSLSSLGMDPVQVWGLKPTIKNKIRSEWRDLKIGELVLFYAKKYFFYSARVYLKIHNPDLAKKIWGISEDGRTWEYIYIVRDGKQLKMPFEPVSIGYAPKMAIMGATLIDGEKLAVIQSQLASYSEDFVQEKYVKNTNEINDRIYKIPSEPQGLLLRDGGTKVYIRGESKMGKTKRSGVVDFEEVQKRNSRTGSRGEVFVMKVEKDHLVSIGKKDLAEKVRRISLEDIYAGYDILSYDENGNEKKIEVKSTVLERRERFNFHISSNEKKTAEQSENYYIYLVNAVESEYPEISILEHPFKNDHLVIEPTNFKVKGQFKD